MAQIQKGTTYSTGDQVTATNLNALADAAILLPGAITDQTAKTVPLAADTVLIHSAADTALRKSTLTQLFANATGIPLTTGVTGILPAANGGTGVANASTLTLAGNVTHAGAFTQSFTATANTSLTLPITGTLATLAGSEALSNKTITASPISGSTGAFTTLSSSAGATFSEANAITTSQGTAGFGSFYAKGSGTNDAYLFLGNVTSGERGRISVNNSSQVIIGVGGSATTIGTFSSTGLAVTGALSSTTGANFATSSGNVGIGTTSPVSKLDVVETATIKRVTSGNNMDLNFYNGSGAGTAGNVSRIRSDGDGISNDYGALSFWTGRIATAAITERMRIDSSGNVGIGTASPATQLDVSSNTGTEIITRRNGGRTVNTYADGTNAIIAYSTGALRVGETTSTVGANFTERLRIDGSGNVGIGVTPSASSACTNIELPYGATLSARSNTVAPQFAMMSNAVGNWYAPTYKVNGYATQYTQQGFDGSHAWYTAVSGTAGNAISFTQAMTLDASGNLGIGTTPNAGFALDIIRSGVDVKQRMANSSSGNVQISMTTVGQQDWAFGVDRSDSGKFKIAASGAVASSTAITLTPSGNVGIAISSPAGAFDVRGNGQAVTTIFYGNTSSNASYPTIMRSSSGDNLFYVRSDGLVVMPKVYSDWTTASAANVNIDSDGNLYRSTSSQKYKRNITDYTRGLADVLKLRPVFYKGKSENDGENQFAGLIAEDVAEAGLDEFVVKAADGTPDALAYSNMVALTVKAIQELNANLVAELQSVRQRLAALENS